MNKACCGGAGSTRAAEFGNPGLSAGHGYSDAHAFFPVKKWHVALLLTS